MAKQFFWKDYFIKKGRKDIISEIDKKYYLAHRDEIRASQKAYYLANREKIKEAAKLRMREKRALERQLQGSIPKTKQIVSESVIS